MISCDILVIARAMFFRPKQSPHCVGDCFAATNAARNDVNEMNKSGTPCEIPLLILPDKRFLVLAEFLFDFGNLCLVLFDLVAFGYAFEALVFTASGECDRGGYDGNADRNVGG